jgi:hypothetical protein
VVPVENGLTTYYIFPYRGTMSVEPSPNIKYKQIQLQRQMDGVIAEECDKGTAFERVFPWNQHHGTISVEPYQWNHISGTISVEPYQWNHISGTISAEPYQWNHISGTMSVEPYQRNHISGTISVEPCQWNHVGRNQHRGTNTMD